MYLTKKQVKGLLDITDNDRPALTQIVIDTHNDHTVLVCTDSYRLVALELNHDFDSKVGQAINRFKFWEWYKLAKPGATLSEEWLLSMIVDREYEYPKWQNIVDRAAAPTEHLGINPKYLQTLCDIAGNMSLMFTHCEGGMFRALEDGNLYVLMGLRANG